MGEAETKELQESLSYGANTVRDGVNISSSTKRNPVVLPSDIAGLQDLECYLRYPSEVPGTKTKMQFFS